MKKLKIKTAFSLKLYSKFDTGIIKGTRHCNRTSNGHTKKWYHENSDPLFYLVPFAQYRKYKKHPWRSVTFSRVAG